MKSFVWFTTVLLLCVELAHAAYITPIHAHRQNHRTPKSNSRSLRRRATRTTCTPPTTNTTDTNADNTTDPSSGQVNAANGGGFPSLGFSMPSSVPSSLDGWWSDYESEVGFLGFSYGVDGCQSASTLKSEFQDIRNRFNGRYVRLYGACDRNGFYDDIVDAAWNAGVGVYALIWFGFDGGDEWKTRRDSLFATLHSNPKAKFVTRAVQFGSEPLYDNVLDPDTLASQVKSAKSNLASLGILVTVSDMAYGYQSNGGAQSVLDAIDFVALHMLPFFSSKATTADASWSFIQNDLSWTNARAGGKKTVFTENGWPSIQSGSTRSSSPNAVANVQQEQDYFDLLDSKCSQLKSNTGGGIGWFAHLYSEDQGDGYGVLNNGKLKFPFSPKTSC